MFVYHDFGISVKEYEARGKKNDFPVIDQCPHCKGRIRLSRHGYYWRNAIETDHRSISGTVLVLRQNIKAISKADIIFLLR